MSDNQHAIDEGRKFRASVDRYFDQAAVLTEHPEGF